MNNFMKKNIKLLNLVDNGFSGYTILKIIRTCNDHFITINDLKKMQKTDMLYDSIIKAFFQMNDSYFSINCLLYFDLNLIVIDALHEKFKTLESLSKNINQLDDFSLQNKTKERIIHALKQLELIKHTNLEGLLIGEITKDEPILNSRLKETILKDYPNISVQDYEETMDSLIKKQFVTLKLDGLHIKRILISDYFSDINDHRDEIVLNRLKGESIQSIAYREKVSKENIRQIILDRLKEYPIFFDEEKYYKLLNIYDLTNSDLILLGLHDLKLINYVKEKYTLKPFRNLLDYIFDHKMNNTLLANEILKEKNLIMIDDEIISLDFVSILKKFVQIKKIYSFNLNEMKKEYNEFLSYNKVESSSLYITTRDDVILKNKKLEKNDCFLSLGNQLFYVYKTDSFNSDFIEKLDSFFSEFYGYGSIAVFFENNKDLCEQNNIFDERQLYIVSKKMFQKKYNDKIEFIRNPTFSTKGINKTVFIENLILDINLPCTVNEYIDYVQKVTGFKQEVILANYGNIINQFKNSDGLLSLDDEVSEEENDYLRSIIDHKKCISFSWLLNCLKLKYGYNAQKIVNTNNLKRLGYIKTNTTVFLNSFSTRFDAVVDAIDSLDEYVFSENELSQISNIEYFYYRAYDFVDSNILLKKDKNHYLNLRKRNQTNILCEFKKDFIKSINSYEIFNLNDYLLSAQFKNLLDFNEEYKSILLSFDTEEAIKFIIKSLREFRYIEINSTFIFSKKELSIKVLINDMLLDEGSLTMLELKDKLFDNYHLEKNLSNNELSDMGFYCPKSSQKIYLSKEYYEKEVEEYLDGNS